MSYLVLARKWRPQTFDEIVGQEHVSRTLTNAIRSNRVAHAFLFTGVRGVGKTTAARILAKALNCEHGPTPTPCNRCANCVEITAGNAVDVLEIDGASNTGVDDVREIIENVRYQPAKSRFKIYIIDEVHMLSTSAFNALLKTLEEPPGHVKFIFATTDPHKVPHTIHSRCQRYDFKRIPPRLVAERLAEIVRSEEVDISERALFTIAREGEGSMRDAQSLLDQVIAFAGKTIRDEDVVSALGVADRKLLYGVADAIVERDPPRALALLNELHQYGYDMRRFTRELLEHFRNLSVARLLPDADLLADLSDEERTEAGRQAQKMSTEDLDRAFRSTPKPRWPAWPTRNWYSR
jgi:DNA polymerase-3 subunit gamma/tau